MLLSAFFVSILNILTTHTLLTRKKSIMYCFIAYILNSLFAFSVAILSIKYIHNPTILKYILYSAGFMYIIYTHLVFKESIQKKTFTMLSISMFSTIAFFIATTLVKLFGGIVDERYIQSVIYISRFCLQILLLVVIYFRLGNSYKKVLSLVSDKTISFMSLYPMIGYLLLVNNYPTSFPNFRNFNTLYDMFLFLVFIISGYLLVFAGISSASKIISLQYNYKIIENQVELQRQNYKILNESTEKLYALKHDTRQHFSAIKSMLDEKKYKQTLDYIEQFNQNELTKSIPTLCQNFTADSIIKYYMSIAINKEIEFKTKLNIPEDIHINSLDLCVVLGNCLENAIEACEKVSPDNKKFIEITSQIVNSHLVIKIINSFNGLVIKTGETIHSIKNEASHGIGIISVKETVNKYKGNVDIKYTIDEFEIDVIMNIN